MITAIRRRLEDREEGFTLIELLVVVIIIGILAAVAIPTFLNQRERGFQAALTSDVRNAAIEVESHFTSNAAYPSDTEWGTNGAGLDVEVSNATTTLEYAATADGFCIIGWRGDLDGTIEYDNTDGGIQQYDEDSTATTCTVAATP